MSGRPKRASAIAGVAAATAALLGPVSTGHATIVAPAAAPATGGALQPAVTGSRQSQRGRIQKKDTFGFVWGGGKPKQEPQVASQKAAASSKEKTKIAGSSKRAASKRRRDDGAQKKRKRVRIRVRGATSPRQPAGFDAVAAGVAAPRVRLVLGQAPSLPRDVLKEEGRSGSSLKISKLFGTQFSSKYRSTFAANIRSFIARHGDELVVPGLLSHLKLEEDVPDAECSIVRGWKIKMKTDDGSFWLRIYEDRSQSTCYQCSCLGWGAAPSGLATTSKFHIVVVSAAVVPVYAGATEQTTKAVLSLHGVLHSNGTGHLRHVNGKEGGGEHTGTLMMQVWDSLCVALGARMVSVQDVSARSGMYLRFTHAVANGRTWYGKWQYGFQRGSFGLQSKDYAEAVSALREVSFDQLGADLRDPSLIRELTRLAQRYQQGDGTISTLSRLFQNLMVSCRRSTPAASSVSVIDPATALADLYAVSCQICTKARAAVTSSIREATDIGANSSTAARWVTTILDCKWFAKDYTRRPDVTGLLRVRCTLREPHHICCPGPRLEGTLARSAISIKLAAVILFKDTAGQARLHELHQDRLPLHVAFFIQLECVCCGMHAVRACVSCVCPTRLQRMSS